MMVFRTVEYEWIDMTDISNSEWSTFELNTTVDVAK